MTRTPLSSLFIALFAPVLHAQAQDVNALPGVVVRDTPIIESNDVDAQSGLTTRVTRTQVRNLGALDLAAALRMTPGVQISRYNEVGSYSGDQGGNVYIRGMGASRPGAEIKTYLDGIPLYMGLWNHPLMDLLPLTAIDSIDVHKGPQNQFGGNNFGAVDLRSRRATQDGLHGEVNLSVGSFDTRVAQGLLLGRADDWDVMLALGHARSDGDRDNAGSELNNAVGRIGRRINSAWSLSAGFVVVRNEVGDPGDERYPVSRTTVGPYSTNGVGRNDTATNLFTLGVAHDHGPWTGEFTAYVNRGYNNLVDDPSNGTFDSRFTMHGFRWREALSPWKGGQLSLGLDQDTVSGSVTGPNAGAAVGTPFAFGVAGRAEVPSFRLSSAYVGLVQDIQARQDWLLRPSLGVRLYDSNVYSSKAAPQAGLSLISSWGTVYANYTEGLLYPGAETYTLTRAIPMAFAADNGWDRLLPTENQQLEVGAQWRVAASTQLDVSLFQSEVSKRYVWSGFYAGAIATPASGTWRNDFPDYKVRGAELLLRHQVGDNWSLFAGVTTLDSTLDNLPYVPDTAVSLGANGRALGLRLAFDVQHQSGMYALTQDRGAFSPQRVDGFTVANARVALPLAALGRKGEVYLSLNNLFDADYAYNAGYPMPGRNVRVGLIASF